MPEYQKTVLWPSCDGEWFDKAHTFVAGTPGYNGWTVHDTSSAGTPTYVIDDGGGFTATCSNTNEAQIVDLDQNDILPFDIDEIQSFTFYAKVAGVDSVTTIVLGLGGNRNDVPDNVAQNAWFRIQGSVDTDNVVVETDDGTTDNDDKATGQTLASTLKKFTIDFSNGKSDIRFFIDDNRVAAGTTFSMAAYTGQLQPIFQVQKASGTGVPSITIEGIEAVPLSRSLS